MAAILMMGSLVLTSCDDDDDDNPPQPMGDGTTRITENTTWAGDQVHMLTGRTIVTNGATLTIEPGAIIKAAEGSQSLASLLIIAQGAKIDAVGEPDNPIIFTSVLDEIQPGQIISPNLDVNNSGLWGGVVLLGNARISADASVEQIEGIPASVSEGQYGGSDDSDNSGRLKYVSIRHAGTTLSEGNDLNGLTLGGVGSMTEIDHIEIFANFDDGIEPFGGTVNVSDILVWAQGDDAYDVDQAYSGTIENFVYIAGANSDHALEIDGPEGTISGSVTLRNGSLKGLGLVTENEDGEFDGPSYADFRDGALGTFENLYFFNFSQNSDVELDVEEDQDGNPLAVQPTYDNYINSELNFINWEFNVDHLTAVNEGNTTIDAIFDDTTENGAFTQRPPGAMIVSTPTVGADLSEFEGWTLADAEGELADFE
jgi:hypothetical protein